ncbi:threonine aldolase family protein [Xylanimonas protaetiae]|uniref:Threonine aldolase n=1 Tax=Xylanimonas protaetiae TaxID=2509457 RepID=A0A4P6F888_9MICO|nr:beta-eliminating lyase-related protein [Xylanimonas protaetiae]QAY71755.1 threonine aldolase [Xylanimonas protaetiae]
MPPFGSDNYAPTHPEVLAAIAAANEGYAVAYGDDAWTARLADRVRDVFGAGATAFPVLNGTGANVVSLMATTSRWAGVVASDVAHAHTDENGAPERVGGLKLLTRPAVDGKIEPLDVAAWFGELGDVHRAQPQVLTLTQATELGTVYDVEELTALVEVAHGMGLAVHVDGSRLANAAAHLGVGLRALTTDVGVDVVSLGAAKNGGLLGEAVVVLGPDDAPTPGAADARRAAAAAVPFLRKSTMQLASKARYVSAQLLAMLDGDEPLWHRNASAANAAAQRLRAGVEALGGDVVRVTRPTQSNAVFATLPRAAADRLRERTRFYDWADGETLDRVEVRWMCSWATTPADVDAFLAALRAATAA